MRQEMEKEMWNRDREKMNQRDRHARKRERDKDLDRETTVCSDPLPGQQLALKSAPCPRAQAEVATHSSQVSGSLILKIYTPLQCQSLPEDLWDTVTPQ